MYFRDVFLFNPLYFHCNRYAIKFVGLALRACRLATPLMSYGDHWQELRLFCRLFRSDTYTFQVLQERQIFFSRISDILMQTPIYRREVSTSHTKKVFRAWHCGWLILQVTDIVGDWYCRWLTLGPDTVGVWYCRWLTLGLDTVGDWYCRWLIL